MTCDCRETDEIRLPPFEVNHERNGNWECAFQHVADEDKGGRPPIEVSLGIPESWVLVTHFSEIWCACPTREEIGQRNRTNEVAEQGNDDWVAEVHRCKHC